MNEITFTVPGLCKTAGSKRAFMRPGMRFPVIVDDCKETKNWQGQVKQFAQTAILEHGITDLFSGPLAVKLDFVMQRTKGHFGSGKNANVLKDSAPRYHTVKPDVLKMGRAIEDALTGVLWVDDSQIAIEVLRKTYGQRPGVTITVKQIKYQTLAGDEESEAAELFAEVR
jgi:Holliday junction resolvase RusA-like endonuclease